MPTIYDTQSEWAVKNFEECWAALDEIYYAPDDFSFWFRLKWRAVILAQKQLAGGR